MRGWLKVGLGISRTNRLRKGGSILDARFGGVALIRDAILDAFAHLVRTRSQAPLVAAQHHCASIGEIDALACGLGGLVRAEPGALVALAAPGGPGFLAGFLALRRAGCAVLLIDPQTPRAGREHIAASLGAAGVLHLRRAWPAPNDFSFTPLAPHPGRTPARLEPEIAVVKLTSGSTGEPRGILCRTETLIADDTALARTMGLALTPEQAREERILAAIPLSHSYGFSSIALPALLRGSLLVVPEAGSPLAAIRAARWGEVGFMPTVPAYLQAVVRLRQPPPLPAALRLVITAGAPLAPETAHRFRATYGLPVRVFYGASECGGISFDREGSAGERGTLGTPVEGVRVELEPVEEGPGGRIAVFSKAVAEGYFPEPDPRLGGGRFLTNDLAGFAAGELVLFGRCDDLINVKGKKVNPREVEQVLARCAGVEDVVVFGVPIPEQGCACVRAVVACRPRKLTSEQLQAFCRDHLPEHQVPRSWVLVRELPRTPRGKLDRAALLALEPEVLAVGAGDG